MEVRALSVEAWLSGPLPGIPPLLMPVAHSLVQAQQELRSAAAGLTAEELRARPGGAASIGFHLRHIAGSTDRLLTYALDRALTAEQLAALAAEPDETPAGAAELLAGVDEMVDRVLVELRQTREAQLLDARQVGRARLPTTMLGLLFHIAEHTQRHTGQVIATAQVVRSIDSRS
jgi:uncharacterized damage-inducible protein DinB